MSSGFIQTAVARGRDGSQVRREGSPVLRGLPVRAVLLAHPTARGRSTGAKCGPYVVCAWCSARLPGLGDPSQGGRRKCPICLGSFQPQQPAGRQAFALRPPRAQQPAGSQALALWQPPAKLRCKARGEARQERSEATCYAVLSVARGATDEEVKAAYTRLALVHHPDKGGQPGMFAKLSDAHDVPVNSARRAQYDLTLPPEGVERPFRAAERPRRATAPPPRLRQASPQLSTSTSSCLCLKGIL